MTVKMTVKMTVGTVTTDYLRVKTRRRRAQALSMNGPVGLFSDEPEPASAEAKTPPPITDEVRTIAREIASRLSVGTSIDPRKVGPGLVGAKARTGWDDEDLIAHCVDTLKRNRPREPSAFLAKHLATRVTADTVVSSSLERMAEAMAEVERLSDALGDDAIFDADSPITALEDRLEAAGVIGPDDGLPEPKDVKPADVEKVHQLAVQVIKEFRRRES
jgi:hypothetical protein